MQFSWYQGGFQNHCPIYFDVRYVNLFASLNQSILKIVQLSGASGTAYLPLELKSFGNGKWEASSSYGYGGLWADHLYPLSRRDWHGLMGFLKAENVICVFVRHAPFIHNHLYWPIDLRKPNRHTYARQLETGNTLEQFCTQVDQKLRWSIHAAQRQSLATQFYPATQWKSEDISEFCQMYRQLMQDKETNSFYLFSEDFFQAHAHAFGDECELAVIRDPHSGKIIAGSLFLLDQTGWAHYHLSASRRDATVTQTVELLLAEASIRYGNAGYQWLHLGGGHNLDESDGLSKFKKKFSSVTFDFDISTWICDEAAYAEERALLPLKHPSYFLIHDARGVN